MRSSSSSTTDAHILRPGIRNNWSPRAYKIPCRRRLPVADIFDPCAEFVQMEEWSKGGIFLEETATDGRHAKTCSLAPFIQKVSPTVHQAIGVVQGNVFSFIPVPRIEFSHSSRIPVMQGKTGTEADEAAWVPIA